MAFFQKLKERLFKSSSRSRPASRRSSMRARQPSPAFVRAHRPRWLGTHGGGSAPRAAGWSGGCSARSGPVLDDAMLESPEELLISADMGVETALKVTASMAEGPVRPTAGGRRDQGGAGGRDRRDPRAGGGLLPLYPSGRRLCWSSASTGRARPPRSASSRASSRGPASG